MDNLLDGSSARQHGNGPDGLLLGVEISLDEDVDQGLETSGVNDLLDLLVVASGDVGDSPGTFLQKIQIGNSFFY